jgi:methionyl-tRNA formyltransferase
LLKAFLLFVMKIVFMGTPQAAVLSLERLLSDGHEISAVWTQPDRPAGRGNKLSASPVKEFALENNLQIFQPTKIKTQESLELFESHQADVAVVVAYGRILPETFLQAFPKGAVNVHFSLLPKYRGAAPVNWAIVNGEEKSGVTTMKMDVGLDTGDILMQRETEIESEENAVELMHKLSILGADLLSETLAMFDELTPQPQNNADATFAPIMKKEDGLIDWKKTAREVSNQVRGFQPFPTSYSYLQEKKMTVWKAETFENEELEIGTAGRILSAKGDELVVSCGNDSALKILELQIEGKRRMSVRDFLNGVKIQVGDVLG